MRAHHRSLFAFCLAVALLGYSAPAWADARSQARRYFQRGLAALEEENFDAAIEAFTQANAALPHPDVQYNLARACVDAGRIEEAIEWYEVYLAQNAQRGDGEEVRGIIESLQSKLQKRPAADAADYVAAGPITNQAARADAEALARTADDIRSLAPQRAAQIDDIVRRLRGIARDPAAKTAPPPAPPPADPTTSANQEPKPPAPAKDETDATLEAPREVEAYEEQAVVTAATGEASAPPDAPAVVWVITQQVIRQRGYESVAEALKAIAGLHVVDDHVFVDVGVRGVLAGLRGQSRLIKVLVNGHPVAFRPTSGNFLGPEMIPIRAVDRIELIRGPASALYGQNAFLGVLQVITRDGGDVRGGALAARWGTNTTAARGPGDPITPTSFSGDFVVGTKAGNMSLLLSGQAGRLDRSGLALPKTSPFCNGDTTAEAGPACDDNDAIVQARGGFSVDDRAAPLSLFGSLSYDFGDAGSLSLQAGLQKLDANAEWLDYGTLTHFNRVALQNLWTRLTLEVSLDDDISLDTFIAYQAGGPTSEHAFRFLRPGAVSADDALHLTERFGSRALSTGSQLSWTINRQFGLRVGVDLDVDDENLVSTDVVFDRDFGVRQAGDQAPVPGAQQTNETFTNTGLYAQLSMEPTDWIDLIGGVRLDYHNLYKASFNGRLGSVFRVTEGLYIKGLYGSSFRAPAPDQLFHGAAYLGDTIGCQNFAPCANQRTLETGNRADLGLEPQTAHTGELVVGYNIAERLNAQITGYLSFVNNLIISFPTQGEVFVTTNGGSYLSSGLELEANGSAPPLAGGDLLIGGHGYFAFQRTEADIPESQFNPAESIREQFRQTSGFPAISAGGGFDIAYLPAKLGLYMEGRFVGPRRASGSNLALETRGYDNNNLPGYFELDANLSTRDLFLLGDRETVLSIRATDLLGSRYSEAGYRGWDIPGRGRTVFLRVIQEL